ncbi:hypothetical protein ACFC1I_13745 [Microbacterium sp. NPDC056044]
MVDSTPDEKDDTRGEAIVFWSWIVFLAAGLAYMITIPLVGR